MIESNFTEFQSSPELKKKLEEYGIGKTFQEGDVILRENAYPNSVPTVKNGAIRVLRTDDDRREILLS